MHHVLCEFFIRRLQLPLHYVLNVPQPLLIPGGRESILCGESKLLPEVAHLAKKVSKTVVISDLPSSVSHKGASLSSESIDSGSSHEGWETLLVD